jgi:PII-like signaling protein
VLSADGSRLRIYIGESERCEKPPRSEWRITQAKATGLAGATVLPGLMGFGANTRVIHTFKIERLAEDLPVISELVVAADNNRGRPLVCRAAQSLGPAGDGGKGRGPRLP